MTTSIDSFAAALNMPIEELTAPRMPKLTAELDQKYGAKPYKNVLREAVEQEKIGDALITLFRDSDGSAQGITIDWPEAPENTVLTIRCGSMAIARDMFQSVFYGVDSIKMEPR